MDTLKYTVKFKYGAFILKFLKSGSQIIFMNPA